MSHMDFGKTLGHCFLRCRRIRVLSLPLFSLKVSPTKTGRGVGLQGQEKTGGEVTSFLG